MRSFIWVSRMGMKYDIGLGRTRCPICNKLLLSDGFDLHEAFFTRGDLRGVQWQDEIYHPFNCVGVCHTVCHIKATSQIGKVQAAKSLIFRHGSEPIKKWINDLPFKSEALRSKALSILQEANNG